MSAQSKSKTKNKPNQHNVSVYLKDIAFTHANLKYDASNDIFMRGKHNCL